MYFSKAQNLHLTGIDGKPLEGVIVTFTSVDQQKALAKVSDNWGNVKIPAFVYPHVMRAALVGFEPYIDTVSVAIVGRREVHLKPQVKDLGEVTITGNIVPGYQGNSVYKVQVIDREDIDRKAATTVSDLLNQELNMQVSTDPALGSSLSMQGTGGEHIKFLVDGVPVIGRKNGMIDLNQLNLSNIAKVEIVKGPMSVLYGSDALGGVVNLITKTAEKEQVSGGANFYYENNGTYNVDGSASAKYRKTLFQVSGGRNFFDGWSNPDTSRWQAWKPKEQYFGDLKLVQSFDRTRVTVQGSYFADKIIDKSNTFITPYYATANDKYYKTTRLTGQVHVSQQFTPKQKLESDAAYSYYRYIKNTYIKNMVDLTQTLTPDSLDDDTTQFRDIFIRSVYSQVLKEDKLSIMGGAEFTAERAIGHRIDGQEHEINDASLFATAEYVAFTKLTLRPSVRFIYNSRFAAPVIPSFSVLYKWKPKVDFRASWSLGYRAPSIKELYLTFVDNGPHNVRGNSDLGAEHSNHWSAGSEVRYAWKKAVFTFSGDVFYTQIENRISLVETDAITGLYTYINLDHFNARGTTVNIKSAVKNFTLNTGFSYTGTRESFEGQVDQPEIAWYPELNAGAEYTLPATGTTFSLWWKYSGVRPVYRLESDSTLSKYNNQDYQLMDASIRQSFLHKRLTITLGARNIMNVMNVKMLGTSAVHGGGGNSGESEAPVGMGTTYFTKLSIAL